MTDQAKEAQRQYMRAWQRANPEKRKAARERYWEKKAQQAAAFKEYKASTSKSSSKSRTASKTSRKK